MHSKGDEVTETETEPKWKKRPRTTIPDGPYRTFTEMWCVKFDREIRMKDCIKDTLCREYSKDENHKCISPYGNTCGDCNHRMRLKIYEPIRDIDSWNNYCGSRGGRGYEEEDEDPEYGEE